MVHPHAVGILSILGQFAELDPVDDILFYCQQEYRALRERLEH